MRGILALICSGALLACSPANAASQVRFIGGFVFLSATGACPSYNPTGDRGVARFRPQLAGTENGDDARLGLFFQEGAMGWRLVNGNPNIGAAVAFKAAEFSDVFDGPGNQTNPPDPQPTIRFLSESPAITTNTQVVTIVAEAQNFEFQAGCTVRFRLVLQRRPES